jgi:hypothetical protein
MSFPDMNLALADCDDGPVLPPGASSLALLQAIYRCPDQPLHTRMKAAIAALPYEHPKLAVTLAVQADDSWAAKLKNAIARSSKAEAYRLIQAGPRAADLAPTAQEVSSASMKRPMALLIRRR